MDCLAGQQDLASSAAMAIDGEVGCRSEAFEALIRPWRHPEQVRSIGDRRENSDAGSRPASVESTIRESRQWSPRLGDAKPPSLGLGDSRRGGMQHKPLSVGINVGLWIDGQREVKGLHERGLDLPD
jgi:hypothetical protein